MGGDNKWTNLHTNFVHRHVRDTVLILEEGNQP